MRKNSKIYFRETVLAAFPQRHLARNPKLIKTAVEILACFIPEPTRAKIPKKLNILLSKYDIQKEVVLELQSFLSGQDHLDQDGISYVRFLEQEVLGFAVYQYRTGKPIPEGEEYLEDLRSETQKGMRNTCCYLCGKVLRRKNAEPASYGKLNPHFCSKRENPECFKAREKQVKNEDAEWRFILGNQKCSNCKKRVVYSSDKKINHIHLGYAFCSETCWGTYRKHFQRSEEKPLKNPIPKYSRLT